MEYKVCLSKKMVIFYSLLSTILGYASFANLMNIVNGTGSVISLGAFSMFGFILLPILIYASYRKNLCTVTVDGVLIGKKMYPFEAFNFKISEYEIPLVDRPIVSIFKKTYHKLVISKNTSKSNYVEQELDIFNRELKKLKQAIQQYKK